MSDFFEWAEEQMRTPAAEAGAYVTEFTAYVTSSGHESPAAALEEATADLHARADEVRATRKPLAAARGRLLRVTFGSPSHHIITEARRWWHPADWFRPTLHVATILCVIEAWETDMDAPEPDEFD